MEEVLGCRTKVKKGKITHLTGLYKCNCGKTKRLYVENMNRHKTKSCGCMFHQCSRDKLYSVWVGMKQRCQNPKSQYYMSYGGRGISVCQDWQQFIPFKDWVDSSNYKPNLSLDRINNNGNYEPGNCRWATPAEQSRNTRQNVSYKGEIARDAARRLGGHVHLVTDRIRRGWSKEKAFNKPINLNYAHRKN